MLLKKGLFVYHVLFLLWVHSVNHIMLKRKDVVFEKLLTNRFILGIRCESTNVLIVNICPKFEL